jgi:hypothetical protein
MDIRHTILVLRLFRSVIHIYQLQKEEIPDDVSWIHSLPSPRDESSMWSLSAQWDILKKQNNNSTL